MWCIGALTEEYRQRMYALLELYARPLCQAEPVICIDEKSLQLVAHSRDPLPMEAGSPTKQDYEYVRHGTTNLFVAVEPKAGQRIVEVTAQRGKTDFVAFVSDLLTNAYAKARRVHLVLDNLNTHFRKSFEDVLGKRAATKLLRRVQFHYTPKHASWLNMASRPAAYAGTTQEQQGAAGETTSLHQLDGERHAGARSGPHCRDVEALQRNRRHHRHAGVPRSFVLPLPGGPVPALEALTLRLAVDPRHEGFIVLFEAPIEQRRFALWRMGYALPDTGPVRLDELRTLSGEAALQQWLRWLPAFELEE